MKKRVLITGSKGFVGSHLIPILEDKYEVAGWDLEDKNDIFESDFEIMMKSTDVVIHLAALTSVNASFEEPEEFFRMNILGTAKVLELAKKWNVKVIYPSSAAVMHRELSPYAESKALAEDICRKFSNVTILRFFNIYGPGMNENSGSLMYEFVKGLKTGKLIVFGDGEQTRDFIHIDDICKIIKEAVDQDWSHGVIDCGTGQAYSINYIAGLFKYYGKVKIEYQMPRREIKWSVADPVWLDTFYHKPLKDIKEGIREVVQYYAAH